MPSLTCHTTKRFRQNTPFMGMANWPQDLVIFVFQEKLQMLTKTALHIWHVTNVW